jgi:hypothetical protein
MVVAVLWFISTFLGLVHISADQQRADGLGGGRIGLRMMSRYDARETFQQPVGWTLRKVPNAPHMNWRFRWYSDPQGRRDVLIPMWAPFAMMAAPAGVLWYRRVRGRRSTVAV